MATVAGASGRGGNGFSPVTAVTFPSAEPDFQLRLGRLAPMMMARRPRNSEFFPGEHVESDDDTHVCMDSAVAVAAPGAGRPGDAVGDAEEQEQRSRQAAPRQGREGLARGEE